ncbi:MAG TPA: hypothetical protein VEI96_13355 [Thermodesulfovibrionales bacterium]|nr:hypothetical protein [Thermodesulfovibrionales bacterium]
MVRSITQILLGLMLSFGAVMLAPRGLSEVKRKNLLRGVYLLFLSGLLFVFAIFAFQSAYSGLRG